MTIHHFPCGIDDLGALLLRASICASGWQDVLRTLDEAFPGAASALRVCSLHLTPPHRRRHSACGSTAPQAEPAHVLATLVPGALFRLSDPSHALPVVGSSALQGGEAFGQGVVLHRTRGHVWTLTVRSPRERASQLDAGLTVFLQRYAEPLCQAFLLCHGLGPRGRAGALSARRFWDPAAFGIALLTPVLRPLIANAAAEDLFGTRRFFFPLPRNGRLRPRLRAADERLAAAAADIAAGRSTGESVEIGMPWDRHRLTIRLEPIARAPEAAFPETGSHRRPDRLIATLHASSPRLAPVGAGEHAAVREQLTLAG